MRLRPSAFVALAAAVLAACGSASSEPASLSSAARAAAEQGNAGGNRLVTVLTRNLYLGAELGAAMQPGLSDAQLLLATTQIWGKVQTNDFDVRAKGIADEIAAKRPELVGLQEAYVWTYNGAVKYGYVASILKELAARGHAYREVASVPLFAFQAPVLAAPGNPPTLGLVGMQDHGVILAREDVNVRNAQGHVYSDLFRVSVGGNVLPVLRGWVSVEAQHEGEWFTFASTHLEAYDAATRVAQARELAGALAAVEGRLVLVGDLNSTPGTEGQAVLADAGLQDVWPRVNRDDPGLTSPFPEVLTDPDIHLTQRIDYVLVRGHVVPRAAGVVGTDPSERVGGLWPSDHAGVWATLHLGGSRAGWRE